MFKVFIFCGDEKLGHFLEQGSTASSYISFGENNDVFTELLNKHKLKKIELNYDSAFKNHFLRSYIDLIGKMGHRYNGLYWWLTNTSAKNQFGSSFFEHLYAFWSIVNYLEEQQSDILIINPPESIIDTLIDYCNLKSINVKVVYGKSKIVRSLNSAKITLMNYARKIHFFNSLIMKKYIANKYFKNKFEKCFDADKSYYVLRSWFFRRSVVPEYHDSFFGILPEYLTKCGENLLIIAGIWDDYVEISKTVAENDEYFIIPQEYFIGYTDLIRVMLDIYRNKINIDEPVEFEGIDVSCILKNAIDEEFKGVEVLKNYIYYYYMKRLLNKVKVHTFTTTYENYPWEKMCFLSIKKYSSQTHIIGYQHSRISFADMTMYLSEYEKDVIPIPDRINTTGAITKQFLQIYGNYDENRLRECCALRSEGIGSGIVQRKRSGSLLLVLGGIPSRAIDTLNFVYKELRNVRKYKIGLRCHPALPLEHFEKKLGFDVSMWDDLVLSQNIDVISDLLQADIVIYDASTISLEALGMGIPIIHVPLNDIISFDPVIQCEHLKWIVDGERNLAKTINEIYNLTDEDFQREQERAREYVENYLHKINDERLNEFVASGI